jgi:hypothetical protein
MGSIEIEVCVETVFMSLLEIIRQHHYFSSAALKLWKQPVFNVLQPLLSPHSLLFALSIGWENKNFSKLKRLSCFSQDVARC